MIYRYDDLIRRLRERADWADHFAILMGRDGDTSAPIMREASDAIEDLIAALTTSNIVIAKSGFICPSCAFGDFGGFHGYKPNFCPNCGVDLSNMEVE